MQNVCENGHFIPKNQHHGYFYLILVTWNIDIGLSHSQHTPISNDTNFQYERRSLGDFFKPKWIFVERLICVVVRYTWIIYPQFSLWTLNSCRIKVLRQVMREAYFPPPPLPSWNENIQYTKYSMRWNIFELKIEKFKKSRASSQNFTFLYKKYMTEFIPMINKYIQYYNLSTAILKTNTNKFTRNSNYFLTPWEKIIFSHPL